ncbi:hypothetical protein J2S74_003056 [Evansella vedderi]|uniref:Uncharacterized protein n=1 Tax=Evansella vedderi TaxID=38282 RepID=A0ABT9ZWS0_9BACI|nr:hypothetical protein [Evansella vedderi]MDQ0255674.1 hypothetical protein [Evansella vedderi]
MNNTEELVQLTKTIRFILILNSRRNKRSFIYFGRACENLLLKQMNDIQIIKYQKSNLGLFYYYNKPTETYIYIE